MFTDFVDKDNYETDKIGWEIIKPYIPTDKILWAPFYCKGTQKFFFKEMGLDLIHEDKDFFSYTPDYDIIVDNPSFSNFKEVCVRLKELDKPFIIIGFSRVLLMKWFQRLFKDHLQVIIPFKRPTFTHLTKPSKGYTPPFGVQYYCYKMNLKKDLIFL